MIDIHFILSLHSRLCDLGISGKGIREYNLLQSAIAGQQYYSDYLSQHIHVAYCINAYHVFNDGNKRTGFLVIKNLVKFGFLFDDRKLSYVILELAKGGMEKDEFYNLVCDCILK